ncbi:MAG: transketolase [Omnitrophica bacterium]|nr:transketolase [Candidatus Omnitrophota bacterium]
MNKKFNIDELKKLARQFRKEILEMISEAGSGHPGGSLSSVEILIALYYYKMNHKPDNPSWPIRDRFIMSKGHASPVLYTTLANSGYFPKEELRNFRKLGSRLQGHVHIGVPGVELSTGSLGQGLSVANGIALGAKIRKLKFNIYCLMGDGEIQEGQVWEAAMTGSHHKLDNICAIIDYNGVQENGPVSEIKNEEPIVDKWKSFGWEVIEIDGHNFEELIPAFDEFDTIKNKPMLILAHTVKGKGVSYMEGKSAWHGKAPNPQQLKQALDEISKGGL